MKDIMSFGSSFDGSCSTHVFASSHSLVRRYAPQPAAAAADDDDDNDKCLSHKALHYCHNISDLASRRGQVLTLDEPICCCFNSHQVAT